ncbi:NAD(P)-dependent oxidoreductase [Tardiphaga sp. 37S4]|uniref:NAD-dependent epimerase/dehydratase family protein n=1 Tax=Tardiphaga sp. 37S4 TaxID=1404741 RepID=UPI001E305B90|nr:NAD(P)-dependent oxidoreductase [Tardiphaga sp. 37S4]UFS73437.1 NAD(P)-dependent oxidoreductase [Tardiphaga sp. 37S4]
MTDPSPPQKGVIAITGATGYIGRSTVRAARSSGYGVVALSRRQPNLTGVGFQHYDLKDEGEIDIPAGCVAILHLAADTQAGTRTDVASEVNAATRIIRAAQQNNLPLVFVSSQTASPDAATDYGRAKWQVEQIMQQTAGCIIRPGLVYGGTPRGLFGQLYSFVKSLPVLPSFLPAPMVQPIHVDDLASGLIQAVERRSAGIINLAQDASITFTQFLRILARDYVRAGRIFVPFPAFLLSLITPVAAVFPRAPDLGRIQSLYAMGEMRTSVDLERLGLRLRPLEDGMHRSGNGQLRRQLREARVLLTYILRQSPPASLLRRYVNAVTALYGADAPIAFPAILEQFPVLIAALEGAAAKQKASRLRSRLSCAVLIAEASPLGSKRFMRDRPVGPVMALFAIGAAVAKDSLMRIGSLILARPLTIVLKALERPAQ